MPAKRRVAKHRERPITPEAVAAFRAGDRSALYRALDLPPWMASPIDAIGPCPWLAGASGAETWPEMCRLHDQLAAVAGEEPTWR